jgi:hypothetical protein
MTTTNGATNSTNAVHQAQALGFNIPRWLTRAKKLKSLKIQRSTSQDWVGSSRHDGGCKEDL